MKYSEYAPFEQANLFGMGVPNEKYAKYFVGASFLKPLTEAEAAKGGCVWLRYFAKR